jgi:glycosyltransferase involved in cell wall biosynthesis
MFAGSIRQNTPGAPHENPPLRPLLERRNHPPFFLDHYSRFCDRIVMFDNQSDDRTVPIINAFPKTQVRTFQTAGTLDDLTHIKIKNSCYKESRGIADWVIVCDSDEFLYHPDLLGILAQYKSQGITLPAIAGYDMTPAALPRPGEHLPAAHPFGVRSPLYDKAIIFNPALDIIYEPGAHRVFVNHDAVLSPAPELKLLHYKFLSKDYFLHRFALLRARLSDNNRRSGWGNHYLLSDEQLRAAYARAWAHRQNIL